jgi:short-subunit dehydrogenase
MSEKKVVLITGCGSGVGLSLVTQLINSNKFRVVVTARPLALKKLGLLGFKDSDSCLLRPLDILSGNSRKTTLKEVTETWGAVDVLVNNAAISFRSSLEEMEQSEEELQMASNYFAPMALIREVLPYMRSKRSGQIINISSVGGMMAMPTMGSYSASKFALEGASEALWYELKPWGISVHLVQPGFINSNSFKKVYRSAKSKLSPAYHAYYEGMEKFIEKLMRRTFATSDSVANKIFRLIEAGSGPLRLPATLDAHAFGLFRRVVPRSVYHSLLFHCLPNVKNWAAADSEFNSESVSDPIKRAANS